MKTYLGSTKFFRNIEVPLENRLQHTLVLGMTGSGKSTTLRSIINQDLAHHSVIVIDGKGDPSLLGAAAGAFQKLLFGRTVEGEVSFNPLIGAPDQVLMSFLDACAFENEFYRGCAARLLLSYLKLVQFEGRTPSIKELSEMAISLEPFKNRITQVENESLGRTFESLLKLGASAYQNNHAGLANRLDTLIHSTWGDSLCTDQSLDFEKAFHEKHHIYIGLQKLANREGSRLLGRMILAKIGNLAADRAKYTYAELYPKPTVSLVIDELAGIAYPGFETLPQTVRSAKVALTLATQTLSDLKAVSHEFAVQIQTNTGVKIIHQQNNEVDADQLAKHIGTQMDNVKILDRVLDVFTPAHQQPERHFIIEPDDLKNLPKGVAIVEQWGRNSKSVSKVKIRQLGAAI